VIAGLLLAAGGAKRFGAQKLLAPLEGAALVCHAALHLADAVDELVIVVGSEAELVRGALHDVPAVVVENTGWRQGIASSIRCGIAALPTSTQAVIVALGDEPRIDSESMRLVTARWVASRAPIVSARYRGRRGHPVLFDRCVFDELSALDGDSGARTVIERRADDVVYVDVDAERPADVDTTDDLERMSE
jgi:molybdenum cofactor cytidylyltransferase